MAEVLSRGDIINTIAADVDMPTKTVEKIMKSLEDAIARQLTTGGEVRLGIGTFKTSARAARTSRNPRTGEPVDVPARTAPAFKAGKLLRDAAALVAPPTPAKPKAAAEAVPSEAAPAEAAPTKAKAAPKAKTAKTESKAEAKPKAPAKPKKK